MKLEVILE